EDLGGAGRGDEVVGERGGVIGGVLAVLIERYGPGHLLRRHIDFRIAGGGEDVAGDGGDRGVGGERDALRAPVAVLHDGGVLAQVERDDKRARTVGRGQRGGLPAARGQPQRGVLKLGLRRRQDHGELAEDLRVGVQGVTGGAPC